jgi:hypothetical protein
MKLYDNAAFYNSVEEMLAHFNDIISTSMNATESMKLFDNATLNNSVEEMFAHFNDTISTSMNDWTYVTNTTNGTDIHWQVYINFTEAQGDAFLKAYMNECSKAGGRGVLATYAVGLKDCPPPGIIADPYMSYYLDFYNLVSPECVDPTTCKNPADTQDYIKWEWDSYRSGCSIYYYAFDNTTVTWDETVY